jgi:hypothetical protein
MIYGWWFGQHPQTNPSFSTQQLRAYETGAGGGSGWGVQFRRYSTGSPGEYTTLVHAGCLRSAGKMTVRKPPFHDILLLRCVLPGDRV